MPLIFYVYLTAACYIGAGIFHFWKSRFFVEMMPTYIPSKYHLKIVYLSGIIEIVLGGMFIMESFRIFAAWGLMALLIAVFPANIQMSITYRKNKSPWFWGTILRLPMQALFIWWLWLFTITK